MKIRPIPSTALLCATIFFTPAFAQTTLDVARYDTEGRLQFPNDTVHWVHAGSVLGSEYRDVPFDPAHPGTIGVVQMEPLAYAHYMEHGAFADGSMFLLTFYTSEAKSQPQLQGFVQGPRELREIHVIDKARFDEDRAFFMFPGEELVSTKVRDGSDCTRCHVAEASLDGVFVQFYPSLRRP